MKTITFFPAIGDIVSGRHILGRRFNDGEVTRVRPHSIDHDLVEITISFKEPVNLGGVPLNRADDFRTEFITTIRWLGTRQGVWTTTEAEELFLQQKN